MKTDDISRREFLKAVAATGCMVSAPFSALAKPEKHAVQPNIILIMADDLGYESVGANGGTSYKTPVLDGLARSGMRFEHCYSQPVCTPSRVQIMTGMYNVRNYVRFTLLDPAATTFGNLFRDAGYATCVIGKWQLGGGFNKPERELFSGPDHFGFDEYSLWQLARYSKYRRYANPVLEVNGKKVDYNNGEYGPDVVSDYGCNFIERNKDKPFFLYYPMILPHGKFEPTPDSPDWNPALRVRDNNVKYFGDMVSYTDKMVGKLIAKLDELGLRENTLVLFTGDNGSPRKVISQLDGRDVKGGKGTTTNAGTHVPLVANWPGVIPEGLVSRDLVDFSDFLPTICECAGISVPASLNVDGQSFMPQLRGESGHPRSWIYSWYSKKGYSKDGRAHVTEFTRNQRYKLYGSGEIYDLRNDELELKPLGTSELDENARAARPMLQKALDKYKDARPLALKIHDR